MIDDIYQDIVEAGSVLIRSQEVTYEELRNLLPMPNANLDRLIEDVKQNVEMYKSKI